MTFKNILWLIKETYYEFLDDKAFKMSAALSYYAAFSIGPMLIIIIAIAGFIFGEEAVKGQIFKEMHGLMGNDGALLLETILKGASSTSQGIFATVLSIIFLILGSIGVFLELQESLNIIWGVELKPGRGLKGFIKNRINSFSLVIATSFVMMISLVVNSVMTILNNYLGKTFSVLFPLADVLNNISSFAFITILFALIYKYLPDAIVPWKYVRIGAVMTAALFTLGKYLIGLYIGNSSYSSTYGAAASMVVLFVWIYYTGIILYFGAEFTQVYRERFGDSKILPDGDAIKIPKVSDLIKQSVSENTNTSGNSK
ncbi:MAG: YihY/virulence factor BrkB family protein [Bacteroidetes bacterium]|nr:YihY/virulence factor BrkB family protein [Bacteroidota bacterium]